VVTVNDQGDKPEHPGLTGGEPPGQGDGVPPAFATTPGGASFDFVAPADPPPLASTMEVAALTAGSKWTSVDAASGETVVTYSFADPATSLFAYDGYPATLSALSEQDRALTRAVLANIEATCNVHFVEVPDNADMCGVVRYGYSQQVSAAQLAGYAYFPSADPRGGDVWLGTDMAAPQWNGFRPDLILHETLHALGLKHPFGAGAVLPVSENVIADTVMSYSPVAGSATGSMSAYPVQPMPLDVQTLQFLYGPADTAPGDTRYDLAGAQFRSGFSTIDDAGGRDTLDAGGLGRGVMLDLRESARSDIGVAVTASGVVNGSFVTTTYTSTLAIAPGTVIEDAIGTGQADTIIGNDAANRFVGGGGNDTIDGGAGLDEADYTGPLAAYAVSNSGGTVVVADGEPGRDGIDTLTHVERLAFSDLRLALDFDGHAGTAARAIGAIFGPSSVHDTYAVGVELSLLDGGMTPVDALQWWLNARLGANASPDAVVDLLYTNVVGHPPGPAEHGYYVGLLRDGSYSPGSLAQFAADTQLNASNIDLVGLAAHGLPYVL
jgi:serralysin